MLYQDVINLINTHLAIVAGITPINPENKQYKPVLLTPYIRTTLLSNEPDQVTIGRDRTIRWGALYQIDCFFPENSGSDQTMIDTIVSYFNTTRFFTDSNDFQVTCTMAWRGSGLVTTPWYRAPVFLRLEWYSFNQ